MLKKNQRILLSMLCLFFLTSSFASANDSRIEMAITVDDLPATGGFNPDLGYYDAAVKMIEAFKKHGVDVYGFVNGFGMNPDVERTKIMNLWKAAGFKFGNHTFSHLSLSKSSAEEFIENIERNEVVLSDFSSSIGEFKVFRFPYLEEGNTKEKRNLVRSYLMRRKYKIAQVTMNFEDWGWEPAFNRCARAKNQEAISKIKSTFLESAKDKIGYSEELAAKIYGDKRKVKHILLLHITNSTAEFLDDLLDMYEKENVKFIPLEDAMVDPIYSEDPGIVSSGGYSFLEQVILAKGYTWPKDSKHPRPEQLLNEICSSTQR